jgi:hypothetical protein
MMSAVTRFAPLAVALAAWTLVSAPARADVYKCAGERGIPVYQEMPCAAGKELRNFQADPPEITVLPAQRANAAAAAAAVAAKTTPATAAKAGNDARPGKSARLAGDASERRNVRLGMTEAEVLAKLGTPDVTAGGRIGGPVRWMYMPAPGDPETTTALVITKGVVTDIERKVIKK